MKIKLNVAEIVSLISTIESELDIKCLAYGLYDKINKEYITEENRHNSFDYYEVYDSYGRYCYSCDESLKNNPLDYLIKHNGRIYLPMLKKGAKKGYYAEFDISQYRYNKAV